MRFYLETYGCTANLGNSRDFEEALTVRGHVPSPLEEAELIIVNTCAVTGRTERKVLKRLRALQGEKLVIAGCLPVALPEKIRDLDCREVTGILGAAYAKSISPSRTAFSPQVCENKGNLCGIINISEGCAGQCSYCLVKIARGWVVSRNIEEIAAKVSEMVSSGTVEIQLASQDATAYGFDGNSRLPHLLDRLARISGRFMIRVGMMNPATAYPLLEDLIHAFSDHKIYKFLHLPLQSGSERVLEAMGRDYTPTEFLEIVQRFRDAFPDFSLTTDVIAGFPGETEEDFQATLNLLCLIQPDKVNVTRYSSRPHTLAAKLHDMPDRIKKDRSRILTKLWLEIAAERNSRYLERTIEVMMTETGMGSSTKGRSENYTGIAVKEPIPLGSMKMVNIIKTTPFYLQGMVI